MDKLTQFLLSAGIAVLLPVVVVFGVFTIIPDMDVPTYPAYVSPPDCLYHYDQTTYTTRDTCTRAQRSDYEASQKAYDEAVKKYQRDVKVNEDKNVLRAEVALGIGVTMFIIAIATRKQSKELSAGLVIGASLVVLGGVGVVAGQLSQLESSSERLVGSLFALAGFVLLTIVLAVIERSIAEDKPPIATAEEHTNHSNDKALMVIPDDEEHRVSTKESDKADEV